MLSGSNLTGTYPFIKSVLLSNQFVQHVTPQIQKLIDEKAKRKRNEQININNTLLTNDELLLELNECIRNSQKHLNLVLDK